MRESDESSDMRAKIKEDRSFFFCSQVGLGVCGQSRDSVCEGGRRGEVQSPQTKQPDLQRKHSSELLLWTDGGRKNWKREQEELGVDEPLFWVFV